jgi:hypothetical protein
MSPVLVAARPSPVGLKLHVPAVAAASVMVPRRAKLLPLGESAEPYLEWPAVVVPGNAAD